jgi:hypothetical protein
MSRTNSQVLDDHHRALLGAALDALLPPTGSFPAPSSTGMIDDFILQHVPPPGEPPAYPGLDLHDLCGILNRLAREPDMTVALQALERETPEQFQALWALAIFGYYSRPGVVTAIQYDHDCAYHGAPLPTGYAHAISPWDAADPLQMPEAPAGRYIATADVRPVNLDALEAGGQ